MKNNIGCWFEIYVADMDRAKAFYQGVFGGTLQDLQMPEMEMWGFPSDQGSYGACGTLVKMEGVEPGGNSTIVYFACDDCAVEQGKVEEMGGRVFREKFPIGEHGFIALVTDTEGNMIGLHSMQ